jgi:alpha-galactosidase
MVDYIHGKGLRAGIYISPGPWTCAGYVGSYQHERSDAEKFAEWGFDFLKYDWCSYGEVYEQRMKQTRDDLLEKKRPYQLMGDILKTLDRDIVFNLCQYGMSDVWQWGGEVGGNCWRTTGDLGLAGGADLPGFYQIGFSNAEHFKYAKPGQWNDPDYILIGWVGDAHNQAVGKPTSLTPNEQYSYMSMWCLMAAPLIFSGDMEKLDDFTLNILCNAEVIEVDQDPLGRHGRRLEGRRPVQHRRGSHKYRRLVESSRHRRPPPGSRPLAAKKSGHVQKQFRGESPKARSYAHPHLPDKQRKISPVIMRIWRGTKNE